MSQGSDGGTDLQPDKPKRRRMWWASTPEEREARKQDEEAARRGELPPKRNDKGLHEL